MFEAEHLDAALDPSRLIDSTVENGLTTLNDVQLAARSTP